MDLLFSNVLLKWTKLMFHKRGNEMLEEKNEIIAYKSDAFTVLHSEMTNLLSIEK